MTAIADLTARPIRFTADIPAWRTILAALGGTLISEAPGWLVYQLGSGRIALHASSQDRPAGSSAIGLETSSPLEWAVKAAAAAGAPISLAHTAHGPSAQVDAKDGTVFSLDSVTPAAAGVGPTQGELTSLAIWHTPLGGHARSIFTALDARPRVLADDEMWTDFRCDGGGLLAVHAADTVGAELAFEWAGNVEEAKALLDAAGVQSALIDEGHSRTLQIADPDGVKEIWINEKQTDLYGYTLGELD
ncbi:MAG: hypothetical protein Q4P07_02415 [Ornithinimicrobium sp.]|uniref:hypothetical protein n=1 Tax=Ornithinimicrobium sp. TaxID=1977084 RepID=UPI0026DFBC00|nr:hypothetical protein [Ornithinimicrobium sp.]MDO5738981.1 hypothetical protein [Ornithinimicrobium sp.]